jgi:hypothetical protein
VARREEGGRRTEDGGRRTEDGGRRTEAAAGVGLLVLYLLWMLPINVASEGMGGWVGRMKLFQKHLARRGNRKISWEWFKLVGAGLQGTPESRAWHRNTGTTQVCVCACARVCGRAGAGGADQRAGLTPG